MTLVLFSTAEIYLGKNFWNLFLLFLLSIFTPVSVRVGLIFKDEAAHALSVSLLLFPFDNYTFYDSPTNGMFRSFVVLALNIAFID